MGNALSLESEQNGGIWFIPIIHISKYISKSFHGRFGNIKKIEKNYFLYGITKKQIKKVKLLYK